MTKINKDIAFDCDDLQQGGIKANVLVYNWDDWLKNVAAANVTVDETTGEISAITNDTGVEAFKFSVPKSANIIATSPIRRNDGIDGYDHSVNVRVASIEQLDKNQISCMRFNKVVVIVKLVEGRAKIYGQNVGLRLIEFEENDGDAGIAGTMRFLAQTDDKEAPEVDLPQLIASDVDLDALETAGA